MGFNTMDTLAKFLFIFLVAHAQSSAYKSYKGYKVFMVQNGDGLESLLTSMSELDVSLNIQKSKTTTQVLLAPELVRRFEEIAQENNLSTKLVVDDFEQLYRDEQCNGEGPFSWTAYYDINDMHSFLRNMSLAYPDWAELVIGGQSYEHRNILGLRIRIPGHEKKPVIFIESGIHAREWIAPATTTYLIYQLLSSADSEIQALRDQFDWHIFPSVNPDGYHYSCTQDRMWRKSRSMSAMSPSGCVGADLNRNWDYHWGGACSSSDPCSYDIYAGSKPFSEIETRTLSEYIGNLTDLTAYITFHANLPAILIPYSDSKDHIDNFDDLVKIGNTSLVYGSKVNRTVEGRDYVGPATAAEIIYAASGGSMDWVRYALGTPLVFTYELRGTNFHWPASKIKEQGDEVTQIILGLVKEGQNLGYFK